MVNGRGEAKAAVASSPRAPNPRAIGNADSILHVAIIHFISTPRQAAAHGAYAPSKAVKSRWDGQDTKGTWWMPWRWKSMKDVVSCDKPRVGATTVDPGISEWGNPAGVMSRHPMPKLLSGILSMGGEAGELKHLSSRTKERNFDSLSSGERNGNSLNRWSSDQRGCRAVHKV